MLDLPPSKSSENPTDHGPIFRLNLKSYIPKVRLEKGCSEEAGNRVIAGIESVAKKLAGYLNAARFNHFLLGLRNVSECEVWSGQSRP